MLNPRNKCLTRKPSEIVKKTSWLESGKDDARGYEKGCIQVLQTHQQSDPHEREIPEALYSKSSKFKGRNVPAGVKPFAIPESEELDNQARKIECGTLVLEPEGTWRDMKKSLYYKFKETSLAVDASMAYDHMKELEKTVDYVSFTRECLACESVYTTKISSLEIPGLPVGFV